MHRAPPLPLFSKLEPGQCQNIRRGADRSLYDICELEIYSYCVSLSDLFLLSLPLQRLRISTFAAKTRKMSTGVGMGECCLSGKLASSDRKPTGHVEEIAGLQTYIAEPEGGSKEKTVIFLVDSASPSLLSQSFES